MIAHERRRVHQPRSRRARTYHVPARKFRILPKIETCAAAAGRTGCQVAKWRHCRTLRAGPHCCFLARIWKPSCFTSCRQPSPAGRLASWLAGLDEADRRGAPKTRRRYATTYSCIWVAAWLLATAAAGVGNACSLSFREAPRLGRRARGKRALRNYRAAA
jgi:hypothetical protein